MNIMHQELKQADVEKANATNVVAKIPSSQQVKMPAIPSAGKV